MKMNKEVIIQIRSDDKIITSKTKYLIGEKVWGIKYIRTFVNHRFTGWKWVLVCNVKLRITALYFYLLDNEIKYLYKLIIKIK